jgi:hypothetical protein
MVFNRITDGKMIEALECIVLKTQKLVYGVIEKASDAGTPQPMGFRFKIQNLSDHSAFPEKMTISKRFLVQQTFEPGNHPEGKDAVAGDVLVTTDLNGGLPEFTVFEQIKGKPGIRLFPQKIRFGEMLYFF